MTERQSWKEKPNQKPIMFLTKQCWSPRYKVSVLSTYGRCHPKGFIVASFNNLKHIVKGHYDRVTIIIILILSRSINFHLHNFYFQASIFLYKFSLFANFFLNCGLVSPGSLFEYKTPKLRENSKYQKWKWYFHIFKTKNHSATRVYNSPWDWAQIGIKLEKYYDRYQTSAGFM